MGSADTQGPLWSQNPEAWINIQEQLHRPLFEAMLAAAKVSPGTRMLDAGCGGGTASALAMERGATVTGIDAAEGLIEHAKESVPGATFSVGDLQHLDFEDESFDVVFAANSVQYAADLIASLQELRRVCTQDGVVVAGLFGPPEGVTYRAIFAAAKEVMPPPPPGAKAGGPFALSAPGVLESKFKEAGMRIMESGKADCPFSYKDFEEHWLGCLGAGPIQNMIKVIGEETLKTAIRAACEAYTAEDGSIRMAPNEFIYVVAS
jgi:SAM-dependent methyltransferase